MEYLIIQRITDSGKLIQQYQEQQQGTYFAMGILQDIPNRSNRGR